MKRAAVYARVSTDEQRGNYSIPTQVAACHSFAAEKGYGIIGESYVDPVTGLDTVAGNGSIRAYVDDYSSREMSRPSLDQAIGYLDTMGYDVLIVYTLDRLARDPFIRRTLELEFERRGAIVQYVKGDYDHSPEGEVRKDLEATFAKWENAKRVERSMRGMRAKADRGLFVAGRPPFGYEIDQKVPGGLAVIEAQASAVRRIFELYVDERLSIRGICGQLESEGVKTYYGKSKWPKSSIHRMLSNETYIGRWYYNKKNTNAPGGRIALRDECEWIEVEVPPIVEQQTFELAQERLGINRERVRRQARRFYLLSSMVICANCGKAYGGETKRAGKQRRKVDAQSYRHRNKEGHCRNRVISARRLEPVVWNEIVKLLLEPEKLQEGYSNALKQHQAANKRQLALRRTVGDKIIKLEQSSQNLTTAYIDPDIGMRKAEFIARRDELESQLLDARRRLEAIEADTANVPVPAQLADLETFTRELMALFEDGQELTPTVKRNLLEVLHVQVYVGEGDEIRIEGWFEPRSARLSSHLSTRYVLLRPQFPWPA